MYDSERCDPRNHAYSFELDDATRNADEAYYRELNARTGTTYGVKTMNTTICQSCALDGITTPARHTVNELALCRNCLNDAHLFAGYKTWSFEDKIARIDLLIELAFPTTRKEVQTADLDATGW
jgi:hypothetical protein